jgi:hypothetical protein
MHLDAIVDEVDAGLTEATFDAVDGAVTVVAVNEAGPGAPSNLVDVRRPVAPTATVDVVGVSRTSISVQWSVDGQGFEVSSCRVYINGLGEVGCGAGPGTHTFPNRAWNSGYTVVVEATNAFGQSLTVPATAYAGAWAAQGYQLWNSPGTRVIDIPVRFRSGPGTGHSVTSSGHLGGRPVSVVCQTQGDWVPLDPGNPGAGGGSVWDFMSDGSWVADIFVNTPGSLGSGYSSNLPQC